MQKLMVEWYLICCCSMKWERGKEAWMGNGEKDEDLEGVWCWRWGEVKRRRRGCEDDDDEWVCKMSWIWTLQLQVVSFFFVSQNVWTNVNLKKKKKEGLRCAFFRLVSNFLEHIFFASLHKYQTVRIQIRHFRKKIKK
jgi:hypothetical protein